MTNRLRMVAEKDFRDSFRENQFYYIAAIFLLFGLALGYLAGSNAADGDEVFGLVLAILVFLGPLVTLTISHDAVAEKWATGELTVLLGLPFARADVVYGSVIGRTAVVGTAILGGFVPAALIGAATYATFDLGLFAGYSLLTVAYGAVYVAIGVGVSATFDSKLRALGATVGLYALFMLLWDVGLYALQLLTIGPEVPAGGLPDWIPFLGVCNPSTAFVFAVRAVLPVYEELTFYPESSAWYLQHWVGIPVLVVWVLVPLAVGTVRFSRIDL